MRYFTVIFAIVLMLGCAGHSRDWSEDFKQNGKDLLLRSETEVRLAKTVTLSVKVKCDLQVLRQAGYKKLDLPGMEATDLKNHVCEPGTQEIRLYDFSEGKTDATGKITRESVLRMLKLAGDRPASVYELLSLGATYPDLLKHFQVTTMGQSLNNIIILADETGLYQDYYVLMQIEPGTLVATVSQD